MTTTGGCSCGSVRYSIEGEPLMSGKCYCRECQKETGTGHMALVAYPAAAITLSGDVSTYTRIGDSGAEVVRKFCPKCGSVVVSYPKILGDVGGIRPGTLDDPSTVQIGFALFGDSAQPWDMPPEGITVFPKMPPA